VYWRCTPTVVVPFLRSPVSSMTSPGIRAAEVLDDVGTHVVADRVLIPDRSAEQVLHPIRAGVAGMLSDRPAVLTRQVGQQPQHERPGVLAWLHPAKPARDPAQQLVQPCLPSRRDTLWPAATV
jgi:hypothetical protein